MSDQPPRYGSDVQSENDDKIREKYIACATGACVGVGMGYLICMLFDGINGSRSPVSNFSTGINMNASFSFGRHPPTNYVKFALFTNRSAYFGGAGAILGLHATKSKPNKRINDVRVLASNGGQIMGSLMGLSHGYNSMGAFGALVYCVGFGYGGMYLGDWFGYVVGTALDAVL